MAKYAGKGGSITVAAVGIGEMDAWNLIINQNLEGNAVFGDVWEAVSAGSVASWSGDAAGYLDYGDTKQAALVDDLLVATPAAATFALLFKLASTKSFGGNALLETISMAAAVQGKVTIAFTFRGNGAITPTWS